ncbi:Na+/proline symporter [bacterium JGI 053]|nr:Na+/proline symporter [bacterium JGI 053]
MPVNVAAFVLLLVTFAAVALSGARPTSVATLVGGGSLRANAISLIATDITLGTGLVYLFAGAQQNGWLFVLIPICTAGGYFLQAVYVDRILPGRLKSAPNLLSGLNTDIENATGRSTAFARSVSLCLVATFALVLGFEIFASSSIITPLLTTSTDTGPQVAVSLGVFIVTVLYALIGGIRATHRTDFLQVPLAAFAVLGIAWVVLRSPAVPTTSPPPSGTPFSLGVNILTACLAAIATQFYSIINWNTAASVGARNQRALFRTVGIGSGTVLFVFVLLGLAAKTRGMDFGGVVNGLAVIVHSPGIPERIAGLTVLCGMAAILFTTTDALVIAAVHFVVQNVLPPIPEHSERQELRRARKVGAAVFSTSFVVLVALNYLRPDPFYVLLSMVAGIGAFAPLIILAGLLSRRPERLAVISNTVVWSYVTVFLVVGFANAIALKIAPHASTALSLAAMIMGSLGAATLWGRAQHLPSDVYASIVG